MKRIAIQGLEGSYHEQAAKEYFAGETLELVFCRSFRNVIATLKEESDVFGILAIENTIAGSLLQNHELIRTAPCRVIGEHKLRISHCLAALPGTNMEEIQEIASHPMALAQCRDFLDTLPQVKIIEKEDTATSARWIAENRLPGHAAICSRLAAQIYGLHVLREGIETDRQNFTRFLVVAPKIFPAENGPINKASLVFSLPHTVGSLSQVLSVWAFYHLNLTKLQSFPIVGKTWQYLFYADLTFSDDAMYRRSLDAVRPLTEDLEILGEYNESA